MTEIEIRKQDLRKKYSLIRSKINNKTEKSKQILEKLKQDNFYKEAKIVALYKSLPCEVDTTEIIEYMINSGRVVVLPKVVKDDLFFYRISIGEKLIKSSFGIEEPIGDERKLVAKSDIDLVIVPGLCFDEEGNRLGFGKGYYDRFLANTELKTIGICFKEQIIRNELVTTDSYDVKIQRIITDDIE